MRYGSNDVILDASICDDEGMWDVIWRLDSHIIKLTNPGFKNVIVAFAK